MTKGLAALSLDALSSVAYGPEAMMLVLVAGRDAARSTTSVPLTVVITAMLVLLVISYTQVIAAHPEGGGSYSVAKANLGRWPSLLAAASVVVDYVLTVAVSLAAGAASLGSVFPGLAHHLLPVTLDRAGDPHRRQHVRDPGVGQAARAPDRAVPGQHLRDDRGRSAALALRWRRSGRSETFPATETLGILLLLKAFAAGLLRGDRRRGDLERRSGLPEPHGPHGAADRDHARRAPRR